MGEDAALHMARAGLRLLPAHRKGRTTVRVGSTGRGGRASRGRSWDLNETLARSAPRSAAAGREQGRFVALFAQESRLELPVLNRGELACGSHPGRPVSPGYIWTETGGAGAGLSTWLWQKGLAPISTLRGSLPPQSCGSLQHVSPHSRRTGRGARLDPSHKPNPSRRSAVIIPCVSSPQGQQICTQAFETNSPGPGPLRTESFHTTQSFFLNSSSDPGCSHTSAMALLPAVYGGACQPAEQSQTDERSTSSRGEAPLPSRIRARVPLCQFWFQNESSANPENSQVTRGTREGARSAYGRGGTCCPGASAHRVPAVLRPSAYSPPSSSGQPTVTPLHSSRLSGQDRGVAGSADNPKVLPTVTFTEDLGPPGQHGLPPDCCALRFHMELAFFMGTCSTRAGDLNTDALEPLSLRVLQKAV
ncbi:hypothetical protein TREES_T100021432 [Tupaia chinensis]|uniref:Uncharacterized protein n=1 Tax=Tupaia chinensis TaxID=246437 RepID=L9L288_TUPCH|nr:hypothetical protein TREES_T100021432 [Tupaia chinensis]